MPCVKRWVLPPPSTFFSAPHKNLDVPFRGGRTLSLIGLYTFCNGFHVGTPTQKVVDRYTVYVYRVPRMSKCESEKRSERKRRRRVYVERKEAGLCLRCGMPVDGFRYCEKHRLERNARQRRRAERIRGERPKYVRSPEDKVRRQEQHRQRLERLRILKMCVRCGVVEADPRNKTCSACREKDRTDRALVNAELARQGYCTRCRKERAIENRAFCPDCWFKSKAQSALRSSEQWQGIKNLLISQDFRCAYSGKLLVLGDDATLDHKTPRSRGGTNEISNLQWVSRRVNQMKTDFTHEEFIRACAVISKRWPIQNQKPIELVKKSTRNFAG